MQRQLCEEVGISTGLGGVIAYWSMRKMFGLNNFRKSRTASFVFIWPL
jgi:hypothetical protein